MQVIYVSRLINILAHHPETHFLFIQITSAQLLPHKGPSEETKEIKSNVKTLEMSVKGYPRLHDLLS